MTILRCAAALLSIAAVAVVPLALARPDPADAKAAVPPANYRSVFGDYQADADPVLAPWRESNERVRQRGGWRAYAREAAPAAGAGAAAGAASAPNTK